MDFFTCFTCEKTPQNNFSRQNFSVENNYIPGRSVKLPSQIFLNCVLGISESKLAKINDDLLGKLLPGLHWEYKNQD